MDQTLEDRIRERAYCLWLDSGNDGGDGSYFWMMAEREVLAEIEFETLPKLPARPQSEAAEVIEETPIAATAAEIAPATSEALAPIAVTTAEIAPPPSEAAPMPIVAAISDAPAVAAAAPKAAAKKKSARKPRAAKSTKAKATLSVVENTGKGATVTPIRPVAQATAKPAAPTTKARARAGAR